MITLLNIDCMEYMATCKDKQFDLAIVDPPYGIGEDGLKNHSRGKYAKPTLYTPKEWDRETVTSEYIKELRRISKNQIIWGSNYFISKIPYDSSCWVIWDKMNGDSDQADCEIAWTSFKTAIRKFEYLWSGFKMQNYENKIHPTQKPVQLYKWLLKNYARPEFKIIDTHLGSGSSAIAAYDFGCDFVGTEIDREYYDAAVKRFNIHKMQTKLF